jgi:hypothetical protein
MQTRTPLSNTIAAFNLILAMIAEDLEKAGAFSRADFAERLRKILDEAEQKAPDDLKGTDRLDLQIGRQLADILTIEKAATAKQNWNPVVIQGGQNDQSQD